MRVTVQLPTSLVREFDQLVHDANTSRGGAIQRLIERAIHEHAVRERSVEKQRALDEEYVRGWLEQPPIDEEFGWTTSPSTQAHTREIPWVSDAEPSGGPISQRPGDAAPSY